MRPEEYRLRFSRCPTTTAGGYLVIFPDLPGCVSDGDTPEEALRNGYDAARSWLLTAEEFGDPIPQAGYWIGPRVLPHLPQGLERRLAEQANERGLNRDVLATILIAEGLAK